MNNGQNKGESREFRNNKKPYVWLHPPKFIELSIHDELFVLCDKDPKENIAASTADNMKMDHTRLTHDLTARNGMTLGGTGGLISGEKLLKNEEKKQQKENIQKLTNLNNMLQDLLFSTKELSSNVDRTNEYISNDLGLKIKSDLDFFEF